MPPEPPGAERERSEAVPGGLPRFRRARDFRLYDMRGRRCLDLSREGALLGHRPAGVLTAMKAALSQGLDGEVPSAWEGRLASHIARMFTDFPVVRLFASRERAMQAAAEYLGEPLEGVFDPALCQPAGAGVAAAFWRPFLPVPEGARVLLPRLPLTVGGAPAPACFPAAPPQGGTVGDRVAGDTIAGFICAGALRALAAAGVPGAAGRFEPASARLAAALGPGRAWARIGPYVRALFPAEDYPRVHAEFLRAGVLLCPVYPGPSVLPGECSPGETSLLAELFAGIPGG